MIISVFLFVVVLGLFAYIIFDKTKTNSQVNENVTDVEEKLKVGMLGKQSTKAEDPICNAFTAAINEDGTISAKNHLGNILFL